MAKSTMTKNPRKHIGRPSVFTEALADEICERLASGETLTRICEDPHVPAQSTVRLWRRDNPDFSLAYALAREAMAETFADRILAECESAKAGDPAAVAAARLTVDSLKWLSSKFYPRMFSDRMSVDAALDVGVDIEAILRSVADNGAPLVRVDAAPLAQLENDD